MVERGDRGCEEGCLSIPGVHVEVERPADVRVGARDEYGGDLRSRPSGLEARVIQHEIDHLDGVLMLDRIARAAARGDARDARGQRQASEPPGAERSARDAEHAGDADPTAPRRMGLFRASAPHP